MFALKLSRELVANYFFKTLSYFFTFEFSNQFTDPLPVPILCKSSEMFTKEDRHKEGQIWNCF